MAKFRVRPWALPALLLAALAPGNAKQTFVAGQGLSFGRFVAGAGGSITVSPSGARSSTGGVTLLSSPASAATFTNTDTAPSRASNVVAITLPSDGSVTLASGANRMSLTKFTSNPAGTGVMSGGSLSISVGATLTVGANQPRGSYSGSIPVTIQYQ